MSGVPAQDPTEVLRDAQLISDAAFRLGKTSDSDLFQSTLRATAAYQKGEEIAEKIALVQAESVRALKSLEPISFFELKNCWIIGSGFKLNRMSFIITGGLAFLLLFSTAYITSVYDRAQRARQEVTQLDGFPVIENAIRIFDLARHHGSQFGASAETSASPIPRAFMQSVTDVSKYLARNNALDREFIEISRDIAEIEKVVTFPASVIGKMWNFLFATGQAGRSLGATSRTPQPVGQQISVIEATPTARIEITALPTEIRDQLSRLSPSDPVPTLLPNAASPAAGTLSQQVQSYLRDQSQLFSILQLTELQLRMSQTFDFQLKAVASGVQNLQSWILPGLYGALGGTIFFLRRFIRPELPNPDAFRVLFRVTVGAFAGVIFAWVWVIFSGPPASAGSNSSAGPGPFLLAFLVGYSTDLLFQALDQAVDTVSKRVSGK